MFFVFGPTQFKGIKKLLCPSASCSLVAKEPDLNPVAEGVAHNLGEVRSEVGFGSEGGNRTNPFVKDSCFVFKGVCEKTISSRWTTISRAP